MKSLVPVIDRNGHATRRWKNTPEAHVRRLRADVAHDADSVLHARVSPDAAPLGALRESLARFSEPEGATNFCEYASIELQREIGGEIVRVTGLDTEPSLNPNGASIAGIEHHAVLKNGYVYDFTARQFEPDADFPVILPAEEFFAGWSEVERFDEDEQDWLPLD